MPDLTKLSIPIGPADLARHFEQAARAVVATDPTEARRFLMLASLARQGGAR